MPGRVEPPEILPETGLIDLGKPVARPYMVSGWGSDEVNEADDHAPSWVWATGASRLAFRIERPRDLMMTFRCESFPPPAPKQQIRILLNRNKVGEVWLDHQPAQPVISDAVPGESRTPMAATQEPASTPPLVQRPTVHHVILGKDMLREGLNVIDFQYGYTKALNEAFPESEDTRQVSVRWDFVLLSEPDLGSNAVKFGSNAALRNLLEGFSYFEGPGDHQWVWSDGNRSVLSFFIRRVVNHTLRFKAAPFQFVASPPQSIWIFVNGKKIDTIPMEKEVREYAVPIPAGALVPGHNRIEFGYAWIRSPAAVIPGSGDNRRLAVMFFSIRLDAEAASISRAAP